MPLTASKQHIVDICKDFFSSRNEVSFVYIFGSFVTNDTFNDIDVGIYLKSGESAGLEYETKLAEELSRALGISFDILDIRILNKAPSHVLNTIFRKGVAVCVREQELMADMIEETSLDAIANEHIRRQSLEDLIPV